MIKEDKTNIERIIAKIDNDFNPDNSDWIPRVGAWTLEVMSQLNILRTERTKVQLPVKERIAISACAIANANLKVYDNRGCEIKEANDKQCCNGCFSTGNPASETSSSNAVNTTDIYRNDNPSKVPDYLLAETLNSKEWPGRYRVNEYNYVGKSTNNTHNFVIIDNNKIELNFDTDCITVEYDTIKTERSKTYGCEFPIIPNNGLLIEAIGFYCMYKMLCRGYKHPVFNLGASQYGTNPYYIWLQLKEEAKRSVINRGQDIDSAHKQWRNVFFNFTFNPKG